MLYQELPRIESTPLDGWERWLVPALAAAAGLSAAAIFQIAGQTLVAAIALTVGIGIAAVLARRSPVAEAATEPLAGAPDYSLVGSALGLSGDPVALTDREGTLLVVNAAYRERFGSTPPLGLASSEEAGQALMLARSMAWRDGGGCVAG